MPAFFFLSERRKPVKYICRVQDSLFILIRPLKWDFYCTEGRNSGKWKKIEVPSQWELQGFGEYTYGRWYKDKDRNSGMVRRLKNPSMEQGIYRHTFSVPAAYQGQQISLVFDGVMTDTEVSW